MPGSRGQTPAPRAHGGQRRRQMPCRVGIVGRARPLVDTLGRLERDVRPSSRKSQALGLRSADFGATRPREGARARLIGSLEEASFWTPGIWVSRHEKRGQQIPSLQAPVTRMPLSQRGCRLRSPQELSRETSSRSYFWSRRDVLRPHRHDVCFGP